MASQSPFVELCAILNRFQLARVPFSERELEVKLRQHLIANGMPVKQQEVSSLGRYDLIIRQQGMRICLELKKNATTSCAPQLDRYSRAFDGLILVCFKASVPLRRIFEVGQRSAKIPIALVEIRKNCEMV